MTQAIGWVLLVAGIVGGAWLNSGVGPKVSFVASMLMLFVVLGMCGFGLQLIRQPAAKDDDDA